ncbi:hypothetical protein DFH29DRAFT_880554 [Suillus ampliporus]|nr:hypothetical protein DFH29DRAFT_880554 [Suillus ampliporus]
MDTAGSSTSDQKAANVTQLHPPNLDDFEALEDILDIPQEIHTLLLPACDLPVWSLLKFSLPRIDPQQVEADTASCFDTAPPFCQLHPKQPIPPKMFVKRLQAAFYQAIRDGNQSIHDPHYNDELLPLWVMSLWEQLHEVHTAKEEWKNATLWLYHEMERWKKSDCYMCKKMQNDSNNCLRVFHDTWEQLIVLPYNKLVVGPVAMGLRTTLELAHFLSEDGWLSEPLVDMMIASTVSRLSKTYQESYILIADTSFSDAIHMVKNESYCCGPLKDIEESLKTCTVFLVPFHLPSVQHYVVLHIDFEEKSLCYGNSLNLKGSLFKSDISHITKKLQQWFSSCFDGPFHEQAPTLQGGKQVNSCSCGLFMMNIIEHYAFGKSLGIPKPNAARVRWFAATTKSQVQGQQVTTALRKRLAAMTVSNRILCPPSPLSASPEMVIKASPIPDHDQKQKEWPVECENDILKLLTVKYVEPKEEGSNPGPLCKGKSRMTMPLVDSSLHPVIASDCRPTETILHLLVTTFLLIMVGHVPQFLLFSMIGHDRQLNPKEHIDRPCVTRVPEVVTITPSPHCSPSSHNYFPTTHPTPTAPPLYPISGPSTQVSIAMSSIPDLSPPVGLTLFPGFDRMGHCTADMPKTR